MVRSAFVLHVRPGMVDKYVAAHEAVWPEMLQELQDAGFREYSIFLAGNLAIGTFEADDPVRSQAIMRESEVNARWQAEMSGLLEKRVSGAGPTLLPEIFRLD